MVFDQWLLLEVLAVAGNLVYTVFMMLNRRVGWLFGIAASSIGIFIFMHQSVFAQAALNLFYVIMGVYGWWSWGRKGGMELPITRRPFIFHIGIMIVGAVATWLIAKGLAMLPGSQHVLLDGFVTGFSLLATWMLARRILENWGYWIMADAFAIWLYIQLDLYWYAGLFAIYVILSIMGLIRWRNEWKRSEEPVPTDRITPGPANL